MQPHDPSRMHQLRSGAARLVRLATVACLALAVVGSAAVWAQPVSVVTTGHRCIHDKIQQRVLQSVAQEHDNLGTLSAVGLPIVAAEPAPIVEHRGVDYARAVGGTSRKPQRSTKWGKLRITVSTEDLMDPDYHCTRVGQTVNNHNGANVNCTKADILTDKKRDILINSLIPQAVQLHTDRLKVRRQQGNLVVNMSSSEACDSFKVPKAHHRRGLNNTDFVLYVASVPSEKDVVAWGTWCQLFPDARPAVGVINVPAAEIVSAYDHYTTRTVAHEIAHALGFSLTLLNYTKIMKDVSGVRGKPSAVPVINGTTTAQKAREHYGCDNLSYVELEDENGGSAGSHLKMRNAKDELMAPESNAGYYSALTMAIFEDMGFYKADFSKAEVMTWGRNASCAFLNKKCMENNITQWPQMFCNRRIPEYSCTSDRLDIGPCGIGTYAESPESYWDYFNKYPLAGYSPYMDYCPTIIPYSGGACNQNPANAPESFQSFNVFSEAARCFDGAFAPRGIAPWPGFYNGMCANVTCDTSTQTYSVQVKGSPTYVNCTEGQNITLHTYSSDFADESYITCPPYAEVCQGNVKAAMDFEGKHRKAVKMG